MSSTRMPVLFIGHGSPMNAIEDNNFSRAWEQAGEELPQPKAIVCVSAHWETRGTWITGMEKPRTIHDFGGFPRALYEMQYPAPGAPDLAKQICEQIKDTSVQLDQAWGLDHGTWSVLCRMFPQAKIPVLQISLDRSQEAPFHYELGGQLQQLRDEGILVVGSGNIVHNLRLVEWDAHAFDWAVDFDAQARRYILENDHQPLVQYEKLGRAAALSINSAEHYLPLLYVLGLKTEEDPVRFFNEDFVAGSLSMRCVQVG